MKRKSEYRVAKNAPDTCCSAQGFYTSEGEGSHPGAGSLRESRLRGGSLRVRSCVRSFPRSGGTLAARVVMILCLLCVLPMSARAVVVDPGTTFNGHTYRIYGDLGGATVAEAYFESLGGHLATITSAAEDAFLFHHLQSLGLQYVFFGYTDSATEGVWQWVTGEVSGYANWGEGEPNSMDEYEDWGMYYFEDGSWNDEYPEIYIPGEDYYICEWDDLRDISQQPGMETGTGTGGGSGTGTGNSGTGGGTSLPNTSSLDHRAAYGWISLLSALAAAGVYAALLRRERL